MQLAGKKDPSYPLFPQKETGERKRFAPAAIFKTEASQEAVHFALIASQNTNKNTRTEKVAMRLYFLSFLSVLFYRIQLAGDSLLSHLYNFASKFEIDL